MKAIHVIAFVLLIIGGLNWGLYGIVGVDLVAYLPSWLATIVYVLVGLSAIWLAFTHKSACKECSAGASAPMM